MHMFICPYHIYMAKNCELLLRGEPRTCHLFLLYITKKKSKWWLHLNMTASVQEGHNKGITGILKIPAHSLRQHENSHKINTSMALWSREFQIIYFILNTLFLYPKSYFKEVCQFGINFHVLFCRWWTGLGRFLTGVRTTISIICRFKIFFVICQTRK